MGLTKSNSVPHLYCSWLRWPGASSSLCKSSVSREKIANCCQVALQRWQRLFCSSAGAGFYSGQIVARRNSHNWLSNASQLFQLKTCFLTHQLFVVSAVHSLHGLLQYWGGGCYLFCSLARHARNPEPCATAVGQPSDRWAACNCPGLQCTRCRHHEAKAPQVQCLLSCRYTHRVDCFQVVLDRILLASDFLKVQCANA